MAKEEICCYEFNPELWDKKKHVWSDKIFIKASVTQFLHMPLPGTYDKVIPKMQAAIEESGAKVEPKDFLMLTEDLSAWKSNLYINTTKEVPGFDNVKLSGTFLSMAFDGPYSNIPKFIKEFDEYIASEGEKVLKYYFYYTTCPKCSKKYGHNYIVMLAQIKY